MNFTRFFSHPKEELTLILDIQSENVSGALVSFSNDGKPMIMAYQKDDIAFRKLTDSKFLTKAMLASLESVVNTLIMVNLPKLNHADGVRRKVRSTHLLLAPPWCMSQSKTVTLHYDKPTDVGKKEIDRVLADQKKVLEDEYKKSSEADQSTYDVTFFEQKVLDIQCNGYSIKNIESVSVTNLSVSFVTSITSSFFLEQIKVVLDKFMHGYKEYVHSSVLLEYTSLRDIYHSMNEYVLIRTLGELTDIIIIKNGSCVNIASFPCGSHTIARKIARKLQLPTHNAYIYLKTGHQQSDIKIDGKISHYMDNVIKAWESLCVDTFKTIEQSTTIPRTWFHIGTEAQDIFLTSLKNAAEKIHGGGMEFTIITPDVSSAKEDVASSSSCGTVSDRMYLHVRSLEHLLS
ncbi:MAG: cell division protein FtsA [Patescibacteria group bacterium]